MTHDITTARFTHSEGYTAVSFSKDGEFICTGGSDSIARVYQVNNYTHQQEALVMDQHSDHILALAMSRSKILTGDEEGTVLSFDTASAGENVLSVEPSGTVLRSTLPARDISISTNERQAAVATDDENVRVISLLDMSLLHTLKGHRGSVISVSYSPDSAFLVSAGCDGTARVWDMRSGTVEPSCVQVLLKLSYVCVPGKSMEQYKVRWSPNGRFFAIPAADNSVKLVERNTWEVAVSLAGKHTQQITGLAWSSNSRYLTTVGLDRQVVVWDVSARKAILSHTSNNLLCQVDWNPCANVLVFTDDTGALHIWNSVVPIERGNAAPFDSTSTTAATDTAAATFAERTQLTQRDKRLSSAATNLMSELFDDTAAIDDVIGDAEMDDDDDGDERDMDDVMDGGDAANDDGLDDFVVDDDGAGYVDRQAEDSDRWMVSAMSDVSTRSFQPGATPWIGNRRYLAFNMVGSVVSIAQDTAHNTVEFDFYDKSAHRDLHFSDSFKYSLAALSDSGCLLATTTPELANDQSLRAHRTSMSADGGQDSGHGDVSVISYRGFATWSANSDWTYKLPAKEHPKCIATSSYGSAVCTSLGMLRLFTLGGVQRHVQSLPQRVVTCAARNDLLLIIIEAPRVSARPAASSAYSRSSESTKKAIVDYEFVLMTMDGQQKLIRDHCPVSPDSEITWAGFSEEGHPATYDSCGTLRVLHRYWAPQDSCWVPVLDSRIALQGRNAREALWPVAISAKQFVVVACRGSSKKHQRRYPPFPKPILDEIALDIPLLQPESQSGQLESRLLTSQVFAQQASAEAERIGDREDEASDRREELEQDKMLLRLVQMACKADKPQRAIDLAMMVNMENSFDAVIKIAMHQRQSLLAERLMRLKESRFSRIQDDEEDEDDDGAGGGWYKANNNRDNSRNAGDADGEGNGNGQDGGGDDDVEMQSDDNSGSSNQQKGLSRFAARIKAQNSHRPKVTYGRTNKQQRHSDAEDSDTGEASAAARKSGVDAAELGESLATARGQRAGDGGLSTTAPRHFNPFGVCPPSTSMEIKRSDSFFRAAEHLLDSAASTREPSANGDSGTSSPTGAQKRLLGASGDMPLSRKQQKTTTAVGAAKAADATKELSSRMQSKLSVYAFKKDNKAKEALAAPAAPDVAVVVPSNDGLEGE
ncbi:DNA polymerase alpha accessory factor Mcl1 [Coemansia sp. Benny D115]|nr:DNA polymerase alpha accessory factor Mcl1 [Coemansia sp. Benny D115]